MEFEKYVEMTFCLHANIVEACCMKEPGEITKDGIEINYKAGDYMVADSEGCAWIAQKNNFKNKFYKMKENDEIHI